MSDTPTVLADNEPLDDEPEGFWQAVHDDLARMVGNDRTSGRTEQAE